MEKLFSFKLEIKYLILKKIKERDFWSLSFVWFYAFCPFTNTSPSAV